MTPNNDGKSKKPTANDQPSQKTAHYNLDTVQIQSLGIIDSTAQYTIVTTVPILRNILNEKMVGRGQRGAYRGPLGSILALFTALVTAWTASVCPGREYFLVVIIFFLGMAVLWLGFEIRNSWGAPTDKKIGDTIVEELSKPPDAAQLMDEVAQRKSSA